MLKKVLATTLSLILIISMLSALSATVMAEPYKEFKIGEGETVIEAVYFDGGADNYYESDPEAGNHDIRPDEEVQTHDYDKQGGFVGGRAESGLACIGWINAEEWVQYTVQCEITGVYDLSMWGGAGPGGDVMFSCDGVEIGTTYVEDNGEGWQDYALYYVGPFHMTEGKHVIRVDFIDGGINFESIVVKLKEAGGTPPPPPWKPKNFTVGADKTIITAVDFDSGKYYESNPSDGNHDCRPKEDIQTEWGASEFGGNIGWTAGGEWVQYTVAVEQDGKYNFAAWLASAAGSAGNIEISVGDKVVGSTNSSDTDGWQAYSLYPAGEISIPAGKHVIKVEFIDGNTNLSAFEITRTGDMEKPVEEPPPAADNNAADNAGNENNGDNGDNGDAGGGDNAATANAVDSGDEGGNNTLIFIIIGAVIVIALVVIIVIATRKKKK